MAAILRRYDRTTHWVVDLAGRAVHQARAPAEGADTYALAVPFGQPVRSGTLEGLPVPTTALD